MPRIDVRENNAGVNNEYKFDDTANFVYYDGRHICFFSDDISDEFALCDGDDDLKNLITALQKIYDEEI